jgi:hypothetical protein
MVFGMVLLTATAARGAEPPQGSLDAELLRDLDLLGNTNNARDRELGRKLGLIERMRMLESLRQLETDPAAITQPAVTPPPSPPASAPRSPKEVK